jgi:hypothetical protein
MECDPGSLYYRKCYIIDAHGNRNEIIGWTDNDEAVTKSSTTAAGAAWEPQVFGLDMTGQQYQPYAGGNIPFGYLNFMPSTGADPQDLYYMNYVIPGATAWRKQQTYTAGWWMNTFGLRKQQMPEGEVEEMNDGDSPRSTDISPRKNEKMLLATSSLLAVGLFAGISRVMKRRT